MQDTDKLWSCVGSAGVVGVADSAKVDFVGAIVKLHGFDIVIAQQAQKPEAALPFTETQAIIRYGVTPVDGLSFSNSQNAYSLRVYHRSGHGQVQARLMQVAIPPLNVPAPVAEVELIKFVSTPQASFILQQEQKLLQELDFVHNSYYVEVTLSQRTNPLLPPLNPPEVALVQIAPDTILF